ncbi:GDSL esterase/lipase 1 [Platanthera guangdongensis]|uniref:GDSL esterase/lipase 1 n=1 Tax=Platanthera guangdongensis TaxID=2320717 RepID=A0ABR2LHY9_9ASPA
MLNPSKFGFKDGTNACCGSGAYGGSYTCGINKEVGSYELCSTSEDFVWWDSYHGTEKTAKKIADALWDGPPEWVGPYNLKGLFSNYDERKVEDLVGNEETMGEFSF